MRILFVFPNINDAGYKLVGVSTLSALAKRAGHETALFDTSFINTSNLSKVKNFKSQNDIGEEILNFKPIADKSIYGKKGCGSKKRILVKIGVFQT